MGSSLTYIRKSNVDHPFVCKICDAEAVRSIRWRFLLIAALLLGMNRVGS